MSRRRFVETTDPDDPAVVDAVLRWARLTPDDLGAELARFRARPTWRFTVGVVLVTVVLAAIALVLPISAPWALAVAVAVASSVSFLVLAATGVADKHRVHELGLVLGYRRAGFVIPWESVDPGRVHVVENLSALGRQPDPAVLHTHRTGAVATRGLVLNGLNSVTWDPPFVNWVLGTPHPERLAAAIERAMVADGFPAGGLASHAAATAVRAPWQPTGPLLVVRGPSEPVIGLAGGKEPGVPDGDPDPAA